MSVPELPSRRGARSAGGPGGQKARPPGRLPPLLIVLGAAGLVVLVTGGLVLAMLLFRGAGGGTQEVVGSALPPGWQPGNGRGVGQVPPAPRSGEAAPVGTVPPVREAEPLGLPPPELGSESPDGQPFPGTIATPAYGEPAAPPAEEPPPATYEPPRLLYLPTPEYPTFAMRARREGVVNLQVMVSSSGRVLSAEPVGERLGMGFEPAARRAAFNARFEPARRNGEAVEAETRIAIRFRLQ
ncbi:MAG TPA: TonB family protein [Thermoanaerobaculia bacterium]|nr:TonB family protein [Thermoanaerobaculia bacterium]